MDSPSKTARHPPILGTLLPALPFLLALVVFGRTLLNGFTCDDFLVLVHNHYLTNPDLPGACLSDRYFQVSGEGTYRPLVTLLYHLIARLFGAGPFPLHLAALLLHACTAVFVARLAHRLKPGAWALWPGLAFAVHPILTEAVCGIGFMEDVLSTFLVTAGVLTSLWATDAPLRPKRFAVGALATAAILLAAALTKESGIMLLLLATAFVLFGKSGRIQFRPALFLAATLAPAVIFFLIVRFHVFPGADSSAVRLGENIGASAANTVVIFAKYLGRLCYPFQLSVVRHTHLLAGPCDVGLWLAAGLHAALLVSALCALRSPDHRPVGLGIFWFYAALLPTANLVPIFHPEADRYLYLPSIGFFLALAAATQYIAAVRPGLSRPAMAALVVALPVWAAKTVVRTGDWRNNDALWQHELAINPNNDRAMAELAVGANVAGNYAQAEQLARSALELNPNNSPAGLQLARALMHAGSHAQALPVYLQLVANGALQQHHLAQAWHELGFVQEYAMHNTNEAITAYSAALQLDPFMLDASIRLGLIHAAGGRTPEAIAVWESALRRFPDNQLLTHNVSVAKQAMKAPEPDVGR